MKSVLGKNLSKLWRENGYTHEQVSDYLGITQSNLSKIENGERNADNFASTFLMPDGALFWFKNKNQIEDWSIEDVIKCEQYYQVSRSTMLIRLKKLNWIGQRQFDEFGRNVIRDEDRLGYDTSLYKESPENQKYSSIGELIRLTEKAYDEEKITGGKRREILLKSFRNDILYNSDEVNNLG